MNAFLTKINNVLAKLKQHKSYLFLILPIFFILLFIIGAILYTQPSPESSISNQTVNKNNPTLAPNKARFPTITPRIIVNPTKAYVETLHKQDQFEEEYADEQAAIQKNYPWFNKLPLHTNTYFFYFDAETKRFVGKLYPKRSAPTSLNAQTETFKSEIMNQLKTRGIPTTQYPITWQVTPAP